MTAPVQSRDGNPHLTYFDIRTQLSYVWDGVGATIEVCLGGYGEPVLTHITAPLQTGPFFAVVSDFYATCARHAGDQPAYQDRTSEALV